MSQLNAQDRVALRLGQQLMQIEMQADQIARLSQIVAEKAREPKEEEPECPKISE